MQCQHLRLHRQKLDRGWDGTYPCGDELGYHHESTGRILVYAPTREAETSSPHEPGEPEDAGDGNGDGGAPGDDQEEEKDDDVEEITEEDSTRLAFEAELETTENQEPMDVADEISTSHAVVTAPKQEQSENPPEQKTPELKALGV